MNGIRLSKDPRDKHSYAFYIQGGPDFFLTKVERKSVPQLEIFKFLRTSAC